MDARQLQDKFDRLGARLRIHTLAGPGPSRRDVPLLLDIRKDDKSEFFDIGVRPDANGDLDVLDLRKREWPLLLMARDGRDKFLYLCGHDERHWFVAAIPENAGGVSNVATAMEALKPREVLEAQARQGVTGKARRR